MKKGIATTVGTIMVIVVFLMFFGVYLYMIDNTVQSNAKLNLESLEVMKLKTTFFLFNQSLGTTWLMSTVQTIFSTADEAIGCGYIDTRMPENFWYKGRPDTARDFALGQDGQPKKRIPDEPDKYNAIGMNPQICYPRDNHIKQYIVEKLENGGYLNLKNPVEAGGINIDRREPIYGISLNDKSINSIFTQRIVAETSSERGVIDTTTTNNNTIETSLRMMAMSGRSLVELLLIIGDNFYVANNPALNYQPSGSIDTDVNAYKSKVTGVITSAVVSSNLPNSNDITALPDMQQILVVAADNSGLSIVGSKHGLIIAYRMAVRYVEKTTDVLPPAQQLQWPTDSKRVTSCFGYRTDPVDDTGAFHGGLDVGSTVPGIGEPVRAIAGGLVTDVKKNCQTLGNCGGYGNFVQVRHEDGIYSFYAHLSSVSVNIGDTVTAGNQIGIMGNTGKSTGVHLHIEIRRDGTADSRVDPCNYLECSTSTGKICKALPENIKSAYYYEDVTSNTFEKRPIILEIKTEDHLPALNCMSWANDSSVPHVDFNFNKPKDITCCAGYLFACDISPEDLPNLQDDQIIGLGERTSDEVEIQSFCNGRLFGGALECTASGFQEVPNA